jgi:hypothetical protein
MLRLAYLSGVVVALAAQSVALAANPEVDALRRQVKVLREEEKVVVKIIRARYEAVVQQGKLSERQLAAEQLALSKQEKQYLAVASTAEDRETIRAQYRVLRNALSGQTTLDANLIAQLRAQERAQVKLVSGLYRAKIAEIDAVIRAASKTTGKKR